MRQIRTEITLESPVERVWELLAECSIYPYWNPLFQQATGVMVAGEQLNLVVTLPGFSSIVVKPEVLTVEPFKGFCLQQTVYFPGLFSWKYCVELAVISLKHLTITQRFSFGGITGPIFTLVMREEVLAALTKMNDALRHWGEKGNVQCLKC